VPNPSWDSYKGACGRYYRRVRAHAEAGVQVPRDEVGALRKESRRLDEVRAYLISRHEGESLKDWRTRSLDGVMVLDQDTSTVIV
jgi:hypothetical protein